jgi:hypothetical protein
MRAEDLAPLAEVLLGLVTADTNRTYSLTTPCFPANISLQTNILELQCSPKLRFSGNFSTVMFAVPRSGFPWVMPQARMRDISALGMAD